MSPQLQFNLYGFRSEGFDTVVRFGGYRPSVFMQTGLALGMFMAAGTLCAIWLWRTGGRQTLGRIPLSWVCIALAVTTIVCKSTGAIILLALGLAVLEATRHLRSPVLLVALAAIPSVYCAARISGWNADALVALSRNVSEERAGSVQFRIHNETLLIRKAMLRPWLGWGRFGRSFVYFEEGGLLTTVDSMWIAEFGVTGLMGLVAIVSLLALPPLVLLRTYQARHWADPRLAAAAVLSVAVLLWAIDDLFNRMMSPVFPAIAGALVSFVVMARAARTWRGRATHAPAPRLALERHPPA
jgi:hypothetical protein